MSNQSSKIISDNRKILQSTDLINLYKIIRQVANSSEENIYAVLCKNMRHLLKSEYAAIASFQPISKTIELESVTSDNFKVNYLTKRQTMDYYRVTVNDQQLKGFCRKQVHECSDPNSCLISLFPDLFLNKIKIKEHHKHFCFSWLWQKELLAIGLVQFTDNAENYKTKIIKSMVRSTLESIRRINAQKNFNYISSQFNSFTQMSDDAIFLCDDNFSIITWNLAAEEIFQYSKNEIVNKSLFTIVPKESIKKHLLPFEEMEGKLAFTFNKKKVEVEAIKKDNSVFPVELTINFWNQTDKNYYSFIVNDITERKLTAETLKATIQEKVALLQEIHHRVKNNMQAISSLLYLQSKKVTDKKTKELFNECITRVRSMALIHQKLYRSSDFISIYYFKDYIDDLIRELCVSYRIDFGKVKFDVCVDNISFYIDYAIPLGLIINELVSNSLKHAFPSTCKDTRNIAIILSESDDATIKFTYKDNGIGMPENIDPCNTNSLGLTLIKSLAENQLGGTMRFMRNRGVEFQINFSKN